MLGRMNITRLTAFAAAATVAACAYPELAELRSREPNASFTVEAPLACLYERGIQHASAYGSSEPKFQWHMEPGGQVAWFRQPLTLIELRAVGSRTEVRRSQTAGAAAVMQADRFLEFLRGNPCASQ
jgi:hypothetical protein